MTLKQLPHVLAFAIISLQVIINNPAFGQNTKIFCCTYNLTYRLDTVAQHPRNEEFILTIHGSKSFFESKRKLAIDSVYNTLNDANFSQTSFNQMASTLKGMQQTEFSYIIYKDLANKKILFTDQIEPLKRYAYEESIPVWKINSVTKTIGEYNCQQAITSFRGRIFTAWFTKQISIPDGPYEFSGLPGLVVEVSDNKNDYNFRLIRVKQSLISSDMTPSKNTVMTTREQFRKGADSYNMSAVERAAQSGVTFSNPDAAKRNWKEKLSRRNNPLELQ
ncbi:MAG: GLPGLI family protein [Janthinobacterium lividum]